MLEDHELSHTDSLASGFAPMAPTCEIDIDGSSVETYVYQTMGHIMTVMLARRRGGRDPDDGRRRSARSINST